MVFIGFSWVEGVRRYDSQLCYFKWIGTLLYLSFNSTFKDVYSVLGLLVIILHFDNIMKTCLLAITANLILMLIVHADA